jgi:uncharacterized protein (TIGR03437 family)
LTDTPPSYRTISTTPNYQNQLTACLPTEPSLAPLPPPTGTGNVPGAPSLPGIGQPSAVARLASGNYLVIFYGFEVALYDPALNLISQAQLPLAPVEPGAGEQVDQQSVQATLVDLNGDGNLDVVAAVDAVESQINEFGEPLPANFEETIIEIFLGNEGTSFKLASSFALSGTSPNGHAAVSLAVADLNGDHKPDLVIASQIPFTYGGAGGKVSVFLGYGDGTFQAEQVAYSSGPAITGTDETPSAVAIADLNGDGKPDLAFTLQEGHNLFPDGLNFLAVSLGNGDGTFATPVLYPTLGSYFLAIGDLNGDGFPDIVTNGVSILFGDGTGAFPQRLDYWAPSQTGIVLTDLDGDGRTDIVEGNGNPFMLSGVESVLFGRSDGSYFGPKVSLAPAGGLASADFNGDGIPDLVSATNTRVAVLAGDGAGGFSSVFDYDFAANFFYANNSLAIADFNHDGKPDFAVMTQNSTPAQPGMVEVFLNQGQGTFLAPKSFAVPAGAVALTAGDFNGDGKPDLAVVTSSAPEEGTQDSVLIFLGNGDGTFSPPVSYRAGPFANDVVAGDFNGDGKLDLAIVNLGNSGNPPTPLGPASVSLLLGKGDGTFSAGPSTPVAGLLNIAVGDFNRDGILDLAAETEFGLAIVLGRGDGSFGPPTLYPAALGSIVVADLNADNIPDLIVSESYSASYLLGNGDGTFQPPVFLFGSSTSAYLEGVGPGVGSLIAVDLNRDGKIDMVGSAQLGVVSFLNTSQPPPSLTVFSAASFLAGPVSPASLAAAFGKGLALETAAAGGPFPTLLASTTVSVTDATGATQLAPLLYVSPEQINFVVPEGAATGLATVTVSSTPLQITHTAQVQLVPVAPSMFTLNAAGLAAATVLRVSAGGVQTVESVFTEQNGVPTAVPINLGPATDQVYLILYGTGIRNAAAGTVSVNIQGLNAPVSEVGPQPEIVGLDQVQVLMPPALAGTGEVSIVVTAAGVQANTVYVTVE